MARSLRISIVVALSIAAIALPSLVSADGSHTGVHIFDPDGTTADLQTQVTNGRLHALTLPDTRVGVPYRTTISDSTSTTTPTVTGMFAPSATLAITSLTYSNTTGVDATATLTAWQPSSGQPCTGSGATKGLIFSAKVKAGAVVSIPFGYPYVAPLFAPTANWCLRHLVTASSGAAVLLTIVGFRP